MVSNLASHGQNSQNIFALISHEPLTNQIRYVNVLNYGNMKGEKAGDIQVSVGLSYSF